MSSRWLISDTVANSTVVVVMVVACLFCFTNLLQDAKRKRQSGSGNWSEEWMNEASEGELLILKLAGKVCAYWFLSLVVYWLESTVRLQAITTTTMAKSVARCKAVNWIAPLRLCVCVRVLTKKCVNKWDAKQNEFLHDDVVRWWWVALFESPLVFQLCSIIDTVIRQLTERLTKRCLPHAACLLPFLQQLKKWNL